MSLYCAVGGAETELTAQQLNSLQGKSELRIEVYGGVSVTAETPELRLGEASAGVRVVGTNLAGNLLTIEADVRSDRESRIQLQTAWGIANEEGAALAPIAYGIFNLIIPANRDESSSGSYRRTKVMVELKP
jgi:hypothetical protein